MKVLHVAASDSQGGAARASYRLHSALKKSGVNSSMKVLSSATGDQSVSSCAQAGLFTRVICKVSRKWHFHTRRTWATGNPILHTFGNIGAGIVNELNMSDADLLNLHWISSILSIKDIGRIKKPIVWRLADMWAFCGGEHYAPDTPTTRFRQGYLKNNRPQGEKGPDLNKRAWEAKMHYWKNQAFDIVCTTSWLAKCAHESVLFRDQPIHIIPNALDTTNVWRPIPKQVARIALGLPVDKKLILMGADGGISNPYKGGDLLREAVAHMIKRTIKDDFDVVIFGQSGNSSQSPWLCPVHWLGPVNDDRILALAYSAADVMVVPSRLEAFGQTASEAQACGTPVAAFDNSGLADIVLHRETGWLAKAFDTTDLAEGVLWLIADRPRHEVISVNARRMAVERFSESVIATSYLDVYERVLVRHGAKS